MKLQLTICALVAALLGAYVLPAFGAPVVNAAPSAAKTIKKDVKGAELKDKSGKKVGTFDGQIEVTDFKVDKNKKTLLVSGEVTGTAKENGKETKVSQKFKDQAVAFQLGQRCDILTIDIPEGGIHIDLLGLVIDIGPLLIDIFAETGESNLLGNLLCALLGLLDPNP